MELFLIRHLKTPGNLEKRYIGTTDESLAEIPQKESIVCEMRKKLPDVEVIAASPMKRCVETAELLYPGNAVILCSDLRECDFGMFENKNYEELKSVPEYQRWLDSVGTLPFPGGEAHEAFCRRCVDAFTGLVEQFLQEERKTAAFVVHGGTIMAILEQFDIQKRTFYHWQVENGGGFRVMLDEQEWEEGKKVFREIEKL